MKLYKVWWIPQVPGKRFEVEVDTVKEVAKIMEVLANYDMFQFEHNIKSDYTNAGGLMFWDAELDNDDGSLGDWTDFEEYDLEEID